METRTRNVISPPLLVMLDEFDTSLQAERKSPKTRRNYRDAVEQLAAFLSNPPVASVRREHVEQFLVNLEAQGRSASTVATRYRGLQQFWKYVEAEGEVERSPMARMRPPKLPERIRRVVSEDDLRSLLKACDGREFADRRDTAVVRLLLDGGIRMAELVGIQIADVDFAQNVVLVVGKGDRARIVPFGPKTALALRRYLRARDQHEHASSEALWLGVRGPLTDAGVRRILKRRAEAAGIEHLHAHLFRHTWAHLFLISGGQESDLMRLAGWRSPDMARLYGASAAGERAREAHRRHSPGERV